jgi:hypothetical protein
MPHRSGCEGVGRYRAARVPVRQGALGASRALGYGSRAKEQALESHRVKDAMKTVPAGTRPILKLRNCFGRRLSRPLHPGLTSRVSWLKASG